MLISFGCIMLFFFVFFPILKTHLMQDSIHHDYTSLIMRRRGINIHLLSAIHRDSEMQMDVLYCVLCISVQSK